MTTCKLPIVLAAILALTAMTTAAGATNFGYGGGTGYYVGGGFMW